MDSRDALPSFINDDAVLTILVEERPAVVSFHFGLPDAGVIAALHDAGIVMFSTATNLDEATRIANAQIDAITR